MLTAYLATFLRYYLNNNLLVSILGSFFYGFVIFKKLSKAKRELLLTIFCSCFTSYSGFVQFLYQLIIKGCYLKSFFYLNLIVIFNLITMYIGYELSRKMT